MRRRQILGAPLRLFPTICLLLGAAVLVASSGCSGTNDTSTAPDPITDGDESIVPSMAEVQSEVELTSEQAAAIAQALDQWRVELGRSEGLEDVLLEDSPAVRFLGRTAASLDGAQMGALRRMVGRALAARAEQLRPDPAPRSVGLMVGIRGLFRGLDLSHKQAVDIRDALAAARDQVWELCDQYLDGLLSEEELLAGREEVREALRNAIAEILTEEQNARFEQNKLDILARRLNHLLDRYDVRAERRVLHLDAILDLTEEQEDAVLSVIQAAKPDIEAVLSEIKAGSIDASEAWTAFRTVQAETAEAVRALLTDEQMAILDELRLQHEPCRGTVEV